MTFARKCLKCGNEATIRENDLEALSQSERLLCAKENLDFANMVKVTCSHCGTPSLVLRASLKVVDGAAVTQKLMALAQRATDLLDGAFKVQGPLFNAQRRQIIHAWLTNFATNLGDAINALKSGLDDQRNPISSPQIAEALDGMCEEYGKGLQRLEDVTSSNVRKDFQELMTNVRSAISISRAPQLSASAVDAPSPESSVGAVHDEHCEYLRILAQRLTGLASLAFDIKAPRFKYEELATFAADLDRAGRGLNAKGHPTPP